MKIKLLIPLLIICIAICTGCDAPDDNHSEPPQGWTIVCDRQGHFGARNDSSGWVDEDFEGIQLTSRKTAIKEAWQMDTYLRLQQQTRYDKFKHGEWKECDGIEDTNQSK